MRCPICKKLVEPDPSNEQPSYPFCSDRCKLIDLGRWLSGKYTLPVESPQDPIEHEPRSAPENP